jgi:hypothetical protein
VLRRRLLVAVGTLGLGALSWSGPPAVACSCAGPLPSDPPQTVFVGRPVERLGTGDGSTFLPLERWRFAVVQEESGPAPPDPTIVRLFVDHPRTDGMGVSSCDEHGGPPISGDHLYRIFARRWNPDEPDLYAVRMSCSDTHYELVGSAPSTTTSRSAVTASVTTPIRTDATGYAPLIAAGAGGAGAVAVGGLVALRRRRGVASSDHPDLEVLDP